MMNDDIKTIPIKSRLISPGDSNSSYKHCFAITYFQGKQLIAYGSGNNVVITTNTFSIVGQLKGHQEDSIVTAVAWATYSGRLSSFATNHKDYQRIIIWEPKRNSGRWEKLLEFNFDIEINCLSWSKGDNILCAASKKDFQVFIREEFKNLNTQKPDETKFYLNRVYTNDIPTEFCSHSRDSRFILTLPMQSTDNSYENSINGVLIYYKRGKSDNDYSYILIKHPAPVISARWRTSDQTHGNCCFMTVCKDFVVRIWYETGVNEHFQFSVVASTPSSFKILAATFISTSSKNISKNALQDSVENDENDSKKENNQDDTFTYFSEKYKDSYAYGNGHLAKRDCNYRETYVNDKKDLSGSYFYFLTFDEHQNLVIWQVTGLYTKARATPKISQLVIKPIKLGIETEAINNIYAFCRLTSEYSHYDDSKYIPQPTSLSLILQNKLIGLLTSMDLSINSNNLMIANFVSIHGHQSKIKTIRINKDYPFMVTLGEKHNDKNKKTNFNQPFIWTFNDTDVYDPSVFANFTYQLAIDLVAVDWLYSKSKLIGFTGEEFVILPLPLCKAPIAESRQINIDFRFKNLYDKENANVLQFRVLCGNEESNEYNYILAILFEHDFYLLHLHDEKMTELLHLQDPKEEFTDLCDSYISQLFHEPGAVLCLISTKHKVYSILLNKDLVSSSNSDKQTQKFRAAPASTVPQKKPLLPLAEPKTSSLLPKKNEPASCVIIKEVKEDIRSICFIHPAYYIIACDYIIYICRRYHCSSQEVKVFQTIKIDYIPKQIRSNPHGMISIVSDSKIELYHQWRPSSEFNHSNLQWRLFAYKEKNVSCAEWSLDGFLIYASNENIHALTKYMDTFYIDERKMYATIHNSLASFSKSIQDFNPAILIPLAISGRYDLLLNMLDYFNRYSNNARISWFYQDFVLNYNDESKKVFDKDVDALLDSLDNKARMDDLSIFNEREKNEFINFISRLKKVLAIQPEILDQRSIPVARAIALDESHSIPFDLINLAYISVDQIKLLDFVNFQSWESILNSGVFFWMKDLKVLIDKLVPFSINHFDTRKDVSIIILSMTQKFVVLKQLFKKCGEEARAAFFGRDFSKPKEKKSAEKNGYSALSKHDFYTAAAMFCLSGNVDVAIRILMQNTGDIALAYLMCRYTKDNNKSLFKIIDDYMMPKAVEANDYAAIEFFKKQKDQNYQYSLDDRIRSEICGNLISSSNHFYDTRFVSCEVLQTTIEQKADLCLCYLLSGMSFLNAIYLNYLGNYVLHKESDNLKIPESRSISFDISSKFNMIDEPSENDVDETTDEITEETTDEICVKEVQAFSFGGIGSTDYGFASDDFSSDYDDKSDSYSDDEKNNQEDEKDEKDEKDEQVPKFQLRENSNAQQTRPATTTTTRRFSIFSRPIKQPLANEGQNNNNANNETKPKVQLVHFAQLSDSNSNESFPRFNSNDNLQNGDNNNDQKESFPSFGPRPTNLQPISRNAGAAARSNPIRRMSQYFNSSKSTLMNPTSSNLLNKYDNHLFDNLKARQSPLAKISQSPSLKESNYKTFHSDDFDDSDDSEEIGNMSQTVNLSSNLATRKLQSYSNWLLDIIVFNTSRLRLEQFTNCQFSNQDNNLTSLIRKKIREASGNILSMMSYFNDYLIRSCKRRGIISRRLLLISPSDKTKFIQDICYCMILLPDQLVASRFKKQQILQICRTTQTLVDIINRNLIDGLEKSKLFLLLTAALMTSMYILCLYKHDVKMMHKLLKVDLSMPDIESFIKSVKSFVEDDSLKQFLKVEFIPPGSYPKDAKQNHWEENYVSFISPEMRKTFVNLNTSNLPQYASSVIDFLIIDTFIKKIKDLKSNPLLRKTKEYFKGNFNLLLMNFKKYYDLVSQLFTYSTINFPSFIEFDSLEKICENYEDDLNEFTRFLINLDNREDTIFKYSMFIIHKFSLNSSHSGLSSLYTTRKSTKSSLPLSRIGSQNESNISTLNFSEINDNINANHKVVCLTKIVNNFVLEGPKNVANSTSSIYSICMNKDCSVLYYATDNGVKKKVIKTQSMLNLLANQNRELPHNKNSIFLQFDKETNEFTNQQENDQDQDDYDLEEESQNEQQKQQENESQDETTEDYTANSISDENTLHSPSNSTDISQEQSNDQPKSQKKSKLSKNSLKPKSNQPQKIKLNILEETPNCIAMSPTENSILVGYKNGRIDLFFLKDNDNQLLSDSRIVHDISSESHEVSLSDEKSESTESKSKKTKSPNKNDSISKSGSNEELKKSKKSSSKEFSDNKSKSSDKSDSISKSGSSEDLKKSKKSSEKKRKSSDKGGDSPIKSESSEDLKKSKKSKDKKRKDTDRDESSEISQSLKSISQQSTTSSSIKSKKNVINEFNYYSQITICPPNNTTCTAISFSNDGKIIAAAHKGIVSLWSLNIDYESMDDQSLIQTPFSMIDTYSSEVSQIIFMQGTGLIVTSQIESSKFKGNVCFWDALLPGRTALVASLELKEMFGTVLSLAYSPSFSKIFAGTSRGFTCVIDTKMFSIISVVPCFTKKNHDGVQSLQIDPQQMFLVAGSTSGNLACLDVQNYDIIKEKETVHNKKVIKARGKLRDFAVSSILIDGKSIYTCGYDGTVKCLYLNMSS